MTPSTRPLYHVGEQVYVRLCVGMRRGEGLRTIAKVRVRDTRGWFYTLDKPVDVGGIAIEQVYEDEVQQIS
jgi:hypothetical protein